MTFDLILNIALAVSLVAVSVVNIINYIKSAKENRDFLPVIVEAIEEAEKLDELTGEEKLKFALNYIEHHESTKGLKLNLEEIAERIAKLIELTKQVNVR